MGSQWALEVLQGVIIIIMILLHMELLQHVPQVVAIKIGGGFMIYIQDFLGDGKTQDTIAIIGMMKLIPVPLITLGAIQPLTEDFGDGVMEAGQEVTLKVMILMDMVLLMGAMQIVLMDL